MAINDPDLLACAESYASFRFNTGKQPLDLPGRNLVVAAPGVPVYVGASFYAAGRFMVSLYQSTGHLGDFGAWDSNDDEYEFARSGISQEPLKQSRWARLLRRPRVYSGLTRLIISGAIRGNDDDLRFQLKVRGEGWIATVPAPERMAATLSRGSLERALGIWQPPIVPFTYLHVGKD